MEVDGRVKVLEKVLEHCEPCEEDGKTVESEGLCKECEQYMCRACFKHHLKGKFCKHHVFIDVTKSEVKLTKNIELCAVHNETVKFYCKQHIEVGCGECMVMKHNGCTIEYIKDLAINVKKGEQLKLVLKQVDDIELSTVENSETIRKAEEKYKETLVAARTEIGTFRKAIEEKVAKVEAQILVELKQKENETDALFRVLNATNEGVAQTSGGNKHQVASSAETTELSDKQGNISRATLPGQLVFQELDNSIRRFLHSSNKYRTILEQQLESNNARVIWVEKSSTYVELSVELSDVTGGEKQQDWTANCQRILGDITNNLMLQRIEKICPERWNKLRSRLEKIRVTNPDTVVVIQYIQENAVVVVGEDEPVWRMFSQIVSYAAEIVEQEKSYRP